MTASAGRPLFTWVNRLESEWLRCNMRLPGSMERCMHGIFSGGTVSYIARFMAGTA
jgi:hypothetical protein